jgi:hypothetical protein
MFEDTFTSLADVLPCIPVSVALRSGVASKLHDPFFWEIFAPNIREIDITSYLAILQQGAFSDQHLQDIVIQVLKASEMQTCELDAQMAAICDEQVSIWESKAKSELQTSQCGVSNLASVPSPTWSDSTASSSSLESFSFHIPMENSYQVSELCPSFDTTSFGLSPNPFFIPEVINAWDNASNSFLPLVF